MLSSCTFEALKLKQKKKIITSNVDTVVNFLDDDLLTEVKVINVKNSLYIYDRKLKETRLSYGSDSSFIIDINTGINRKWIESQIMPNYIEMSIYSYRGNLVQEVFGDSTLVITRDFSNSVNDTFYTGLNTGFVDLVDFYNAKKRELIKLDSNSIIMQD